MQPLVDSLVGSAASGAGVEAVIGHDRWEEVLRDAALAVSVAHGDAVFAELVGYLAKLLEVDMAFIAVMAEADAGTMRMLALHVDGRDHEPVDYRLEGTPCATVVGQQFRVYPERLAEIFPDDGIFGESALNAYAGFPLTEEDGTPLGVISVISRNRLQDIPRIEPIMRIFAARVGAELARVKAEHALRASEASYRSIFETAEDPIFVQDWDTGAIVDVNPAACHVFGYDADELKRMTLTQLGTELPPDGDEDAAHDDGDTSMHRVAQAKAGGAVRYEWQRVDRNGALHWDEVSLKAAQIGGRRRMLAFTREVTHRKLSEEALRSSEEQYRAIFNTSGDALVLRDAQFRIVDANPAFYAMHGYRPEDVMGKVLPPLLIEEHRPIAQKMLERALAGTPCGGEFRNIRKDGGLLEIDVRMLPVRFHDQPHVLVVARDVTAAKRQQAQGRELQAQLLQAQKMEAIGQLTGGIAHDFNNILTSVLGYLTMAAERVEAYGDAAVERQLGQARAAAQRARDLVGQMLTFSRLRSGDRKPHSLARLVQNAIQLLRPTLPTTIELRTDLDAPLSPVAVDAVQIEQVLFNLCINARDAMQGAGLIRLDTRLCEVDGLVCSSCRARIGGPWVELEVADTGSGIEQSVMERMFDPFFTTKEVGQGSGMGLAMVHGIVHEHGGHVFVSSAPGAGTSFRILLPAVEGGPLPASGALNATRPIRRRLKGRLLLVEDQPMVAGYMEELLRSWGLEVTVHGHPTEAHLWYLRDPKQVDVVLSDQTMPSMTGVQLAAFMTSVRPDLPVLIYTGYGEGIAESDLRGAGVVALLTKPIDPDELRTHLERLLERG